MNANEILFFQIKMIRKGEKPPIWRRAYVPSNITFTQMALILEELLEFPKSDQFEFEFYHKKDRLIEWHEEDAGVHDFYYDYLNAPDTYVNEWFLNEKWFTFRIRGTVGQLPEYRVEIEQAAEKVVLRETNEPLQHPVLQVEKAPREDVFWKCREQMNDSLSRLYRLEKREAEYLYFAELLKDVEEKQNGLGFCVEMINRDIHSKESPSTAIKRFAKQVSGDAYEEMRHEKQQFQQKTTGNLRRPKATVEGILMADTKAGLIEQAQDFNLSVTGKSKKQIAFAIARHLLEPDVMRENLLEAAEADLDLLEYVMEKGVYLPSMDEEDQLDLLWGLNYVASFEDGTFEVPEEVKTIYGILKRTGYREFHKKARWMLFCLRTFDMIHVVAPAKILYQMYRRDKTFRLSFSEFLDLFDRMPGSSNPCCRTGDTVFSKALVKNDMYREIARRQRDVEYYIPTLIEIMSYAVYGYPSEEDAYQDLFVFWQDEMGLDEDECDGLCMLAFREFSTGGMLSDYMDVIEEWGIEFESDRQLEQFANIMMQVNNHTRMFALRGHMPEEMTHLLPRSSQGKKSTIVPMNSMVAEMLENSREQIEGMGFHVDTESNAAAIPKMGFKDGLRGGMTSGVKKIYPNDPCPCGSGKKYKKCCGRK